MESILDWGVSIVLWLQQFSPLLDAPFIAFTMLGDSLFLIPFMASLYFCVDRKLGARLVLFLLVAVYLNAVAKWWAGQPRPFQYDPSIQAIVTAESGGFPSGHTQNAVIMWGYLAFHYNRKWLWIMATLLIILTPLSRVYLGVHFPTDLAGGYLMGAILLWLYLRWEDGLEEWFGTRVLPIQLLLAIIPPMLLLLVLPMQGEDRLTAAGALTGIGIGIALERRWLSFRVSLDWWRRIASFLLGGVLMLTLYLGLKSFFDSIEIDTVIFNHLEVVGLLRYIRYLIIGLCGVLAIPWLFSKLNLVETR